MQYGPIQIYLFDSLALRPAKYQKYSLTNFTLLTLYPYFVGHKVDNTASKHERVWSTQTSIEWPSPKRSVKRTSMNSGGSQSSSCTGRSSRYEGSVKKLRGVSSPPFRFAVGGASRSAVTSGSTLRPSAYNGTEWNEFQIQTGTSRLNFEWFIFNLIKEFRPFCLESWCFCYDFFAFWSWS